MKMLENFTNSNLWEEIYFRKIGILNKETERVPDPTGRPGPEDKHGDLGLGPEPISSKHQQTFCLLNDGVKHLPAHEAQGINITTRAMPKLGNYYSELHAARITLVNNC